MLTRRHALLAGAAGIAALALGQLSEVWGEVSAASGAAERLSVAA